MIELGLQRISQLLQSTPFPWRAIHVAGTNGKGSVCSFISEMLNAYNRSTYRTQHARPPLRHGRFTSPHLVDRWDCISISDGERMAPVPAELFLQVEKALRARSLANGIQPSEFELLTATAFQIFTNMKLDLAVVETGMGGRLDATNIIGQPASVQGGTITQRAQRYRPRPLSTVITQIAMDHQAFLGSTYEAIAREKAGIMKPNAPVTWLQDQPSPDIHHILQQHAEALEVPIINNLELTARRIFDVVPDIYDFPASPLRKANGQLAMLSTWTALARFDRGHGTYLPHQLSRRNDVDHDDIVNLVKDWQSIVQDYVFPGRQEWLSLEPITGRKEPVLLDGAHNVEGVEALSQVVQQLRRDRRSKPGPITWVIGISEAKDRNLEDILQPLLRPGDGVFAVEFGPVDGMPWVTPKTAEDIVQAARAVVPQIEPASSFASNVAGALQAASLHADGSHVVVCGSLYLAGEVHRLLRRHSEGDII